MGSIPLPALAVQQPPSLLQQYAELSRIRSAQTQQQTAQLQQTGLEQENQQRAIELQDSQTLRSLAPNHIIKDKDGNVTGFDMPGLINEAAGKQVNPNTLTKMSNGYAESVKNLAAASEMVRNNEMAKNKAAYELLEGMRGESDVTKRQGVLQNGLPNLQKLGFDTSKLSGIQLDDKSLTNAEASIGMHAQQIADAKTQAETLEKQQQTATAKATELHTEMETAQGGPPATRSMNDWLAKNLGKGPSDYEEHMKKIVPAFNLAIAANTGAGLPSAEVAKKFGMSSEAFDQAAEKYYQTGAMPQMGRGPAGMALQRAVMNRTAELHAGASLAEGSAEYAANKASLTKLQSNLDAVSAFEKTANKNLDLFTGLAQKAINTGIPLLNAPLRTGAKLLAGSENQLALDAARQVAVNEIAKVTSSPGLTGQLSDTARKEIAAFIPESATYGQALSVAKVLKQDMANRHQSYQEQIGDIQKRIGGQGGGGNAKTLTSAQIAQAAKDHNVSIEEATRQAKAAGYEVKP